MSLVYLEVVLHKSGVHFCDEVAGKVYLLMTLPHCPPSSYLKTGHKNMPIFSPFQIWAQRYALSGLFFPPVAWISDFTSLPAKAEVVRKWRVWNVVMWTQCIPRMNPFNSTCRCTNVLHCEHLPCIRCWGVNENATAWKIHSSALFRICVYVWSLFCFTGNRKKRQHDNKLWNFQKKIINC